MANSNTIQPDQQMPCKPLWHWLTALPAGQCQSGLQAGRCRSDFSPTRSLTQALLSD